MRGKQKIVDPARDKYFTVLPNLYDDLGLNLHEYRLLGHYKRIGTTWEGVRTTARKCKMGPNAVIAARRSLAKKKLITIAPDRTDFDTFEITVSDIWERNYKYYASVSRQKHPGGVTKQKQVRFQVVTGVLPDSNGGVTRQKRKKQQIKKKQIKKKQLKKKQQHTPQSVRAAKSKPVDVVSKSPEDAKNFGADLKAQHLYSNLGIDWNVAREFAVMPHMTDEYLSDWLSFAAKNVDEVIRTQDTDKPIQHLGPGYYAKHLRAGDLSPIKARIVEQQKRDEAHKDDPKYWELKKIRAREKEEAKSQSKPRWFDRT